MHRKLNNPVSLTYENIIKTDWVDSLPDTGFEIVSVLQHGQYLYAAANGYVMQLSALTGLIEKSNNLPGLSKNEVNLALSQDGSILIVGTHGSVVALDASDITRQLWINDLKGQDVGIVHLICGANTVYAGTGGYVNAIPLSEPQNFQTNPLKGAGDEEVRLALSPDESQLVVGTKGIVICIDTNNFEGNFAWKNSLSGQGESVVSVMIADGYAYAGTNGHVNQLSMQNGSMQSTNDLKGLDYYEIRLAAAADGNSIYAGINGTVVALSASGLNEQWRCGLPDAQKSIVNLITGNNGLLIAGSAGIVSMITDGEVKYTNTLPGLDTQEVRLALSQDQQQVFFGTNGYAVGASNLGARTINTNNWMEQLGNAIGPVKLRNLFIPGSHDSGSYNITANSGIGPDDGIPGWLQPFINGSDTLRQIAAGWAAAQGQNVYQQLNNGIRYLDLRAATRGSEIWLLHGFYSVNVDDVLQDVARFVSENRQEIIILDFNHFYSFDSDSYLKLANKLKATFSSNIIPRNFDNKGDYLNITVNDIWAKNGQILVLFDDESTVNSCPWLWSEYVDIYSPYYADTTVNGLIADLDTRGHTSHSSFYYLHGQLTPDTGMIIAGEFKSPSNLKELAASSNPSFMQWLTKNYNPAINIMATDWVSETDLVSFAILVNKYYRSSQV